MIAMEYATKILLCYGLTVAGVIGYAAYTIRRGRALAERLPDEDRPWT